jgi:hypothetical protein
MTDGFIPDRMIRKLFTEEGLLELSTNDPDYPTIRKVDGGYKIHDFELHQNTRAKIEKKREAGRLGGLAKAKNRAYVADARDQLQQNPSEPLAIQIQITDTDTSTPAEPVVEKKSRGTRIPEPFSITGEMRSWASDKTPGLNGEWTTETFVDYWRAIPGARGVKTDWLATWRNWMKREYSNMPQIKYAKPSVVQPPKHEDLKSQFCEIHGWYPKPCSRCAEEGSHSENLVQEDSL